MNQREPRANSNFTQWFLMALFPFLSLFPFICFNMLANKMTAKRNLCWPSVPDLRVRRETMVLKAIRCSLKVEPFWSCLVKYGSTLLGSWQVQDCHRKFQANLPVDGNFGAHEHSFHSAFICLHRRLVEPVWIGWDTPKQKVVAILPNQLLLLCRHRSDLQVSCSVLSPHRLLLPHHHLFRLLLAAMVTNWTDMLHG